ncbi:MAG: hypothetical protein IJJ41_05735 [Clostridia bacterium]|nr:hypothetical protein [Clostridia bacterium]MBR0415520.1 hypothetical protein [Clostridia bacterium]
MKKILTILFICLCMALCLIPSVGMLFGKEEESAGNEIKTEKPRIKTEAGALNTEYLPEWGNYFEKNFALRSAAITADNRLMSTLFGVSDIAGVAVGKGGWLYYTSTLDDYLGRNTLSEAQMQGLVQNIEILRDYAAKCGSEFLLCVAPNKNTLYPEHMAYYYAPGATAPRNRDLLHKALAGSDIAYCNLFDVLAAEQETLYLQTDSHWNNKGALLAYNAVLDSLGKPHEDFASAQVTRTKDHRGDLSKMLYPAANDTEYNFYYPTDALFSYVTNTESTEDSLIQTRSEASGSLYMYRDSFGNALVPFFATAYESATFTKSFPMILENDVTGGSADTVIFEIVERNINWFLTQPPVVSAPELMVYEVQAGSACDTGLELKACEYSPAYIEISGNLEYDKREGSPVYVRLESESGQARTFRCFNYLTKGGENGYLAYLKSDMFKAGEAVKVSVLIEKESEFYQIDSKTCTYGGKQ